ncbi:MAG: glycosyl hydrolase family 18 protein, partial [Acidimicrobiales bacterium]
MLSRVRAGQEHLNALYRQLSRLSARLRARAAGLPSGAHEAVAALRARPRHAAGSRSRVPALLASVGLAVPLTGVLFALNSSPARPPRTFSTSTPNARVAQEFGARVPLSLPPATTPPAPSPPVLATIPNLPAHEVFGFAPYWTLGQSQGFEVQDLSTIAYFSLDVGPDGAIDESGPGWEGYQSQALVNLIDRAHSANDRVVLTLTCFDQSSLDQLSSSPAAASSRIAGSLVQLLSAKSLDGVNIDFEGNGPQDRSGLDALVGGLSSKLRAVDPHWQITMDTYASSAGDPGGFFDIAGLAPSVDGFFVMAYDMEDPAVPSATAPLTGGGSNDTSALEEYESVVPASKVVLGVPDYGYEWPTTGQALGSAATGSPTAVTYAQVASMQSPVYWDPATQTPWTAFQSNGQWHQIFFDNPTSIALKSRLAEAAKAAGVGIWALGMDGNDPAIYGALLGSAQASKYATGPSEPQQRPVGQSTTQSPSAPGGATSPSGTSSGTAPAGGATTTTSPAYNYSGTWDSHAENLQPVNPASLPAGGKGTSAGQLTGFQTDNPSVACLS